jgi:hypothetical protein
MEYQNMSRFMDLSKMLIPYHDYQRLSLKQKAEYVSSLIRKTRLELERFCEFLEVYFKSTAIQIGVIERIENEFSFWCEYLYQTFGQYLSFNNKRIDYLIFGPAEDPLLEEYEKDRVREIPKDKLIEYIARVRMYLEEFPLERKVLIQLNLTPESLLHDAESEVESELTKELESFEGFAYIGGEKIALSYPFHTVGIYLSDLPPII